MSKSLATPPRMFGTIAADIFNIVSNRLPVPANNSDTEIAALDKTLGSILSSESVPLYLDELQDITVANPDTPTGKAAKALLGEDNLSALRIAIDEMREISYMQEPSEQKRQKILITVRAFEDRLWKKFAAMEACTLSRLDNESRKPEQKWLKTALCQLYAIGDQNLDLLPSDDYMRSTYSAENTALRQFIEMHLPNVLGDFTKTCEVVTQLYKDKEDNNQTLKEECHSPYLRTGIPHAARERLRTMGVLNRLERAVASQGEDTSPSR